MGNLQSVANAFESVKGPVQVTSSPADLAEATAIILPGVGAFGDGMANLRAAGLIEPLCHEVLNRRKPFLGLCLGMQFLADGSEEHGVHTGLGWIPGTVRRMRPTERQFRIPHMGWNTVQVKRPCPLFADLPEDPVFYFVHGYHFDVAPEANDAVTATCWHGIEFVASVRRDNIFGVQFHPEKSQRDGIKLIENFLALVRGA